ncbi:TPA: terminase TerL endonuclease subunit [Clostridioides difficile]|uniref:Gp2 n=2 Tax=Clostridioides difficile TaxID=1496 RepID=A0A069AFS3_CLODI|nr:terminase TerL endonuclease subunit [Clostridioides difficile]AXU79259.1 terminase [Clostridioides difficile]EGT3760501.1 terminase large subunit [Clostridioides difficile]EGT3769051.1 terminase large subunit [Clostridioides difficile]EGT4111173.1 terminase large subunit [Clostridioides difficile]EGT4517237.1 terminase large subunit [Clostridioides difficile]
MNEKLKEIIDKQLTWNLDDAIGELKNKWDNEKYYYDVEEAKKFLTFASKLELDKGKKGKKIKLIKFQFEICTSIICVKRRSDNLRRFREAHINIPRKNSKSFLIALIASYLYFCKNEFGSETIITANSRDQASLLFNTIHHMVKTNKTLKKYVNILESRKYMFKKNMNAYLRVLSSDAGTADSYAGYVCIIDEIHEAKNRQLYDKLKTGAGIWEEPLMLTITTASSGDNPENLEFELYSYSKELMKGEFEDDSFFYAIYEAEEKCELLDEEQWFKANPALGTFRSYEELKNLAIRATRLKTQEAAFRRLYLNQHVALDGEGAINMELWEKAEREINLEELRNMKTWDGMDMGSTQDITAYVMVFYDEDTNKYIIYPFLFTPKDTIEERSERDDIRYDILVQEKELIALEGRSINYQYMHDYLEETKIKYELETQEIGFDRWGSIGIRNKLEEDYDVLPFGQGYSSMSPAVRDFENILLDERIIIAKNSLFRRMAKNVVAVMDDAGNIKYSKKRSKYKIDGIIAMLMGISRAIFNNEGEQFSTQNNVDKFLNKVMGGEED